MKRRKGLLKYRAPYAKETSLALETNICSVVFNIQVQEFEDVNEFEGEDAEILYFES